MPSWVEEGFNEYSKRIPKPFSLRLIEIAMVKRHKSSNLDEVKQKEARKILAAIPEGDTIVALDQNGAAWTTEELADHLRNLGAYMPIR